MSTKKPILYNPISRRQFLVGAGKTLLALPVLPSLLPEAAYAQSATVPRRLVNLIFDHDNLNTIWPSKSVATQAIGTMGVRERLLSSMGTVVSHSQALRHSLYETLKNQNQMTYIRGFRQEGWDGTHGNMHIAAGGARQSRDNNLPSIDSIIERSLSVYPTTTPSNLVRAIRINLLGGEFGFYNKVGTQIQSLPAYDSYSYRFMYNDVFASLTGGTTAPVDFTNSLKSNILNRVFGAYTTFQNNRRISAEDRARLTQHMDYISDLQRSYASIQPTPVATCSRPTEPTYTTDPLQTFRICLDLTAIALRCGMTKYACIAPESHDPQWLPGNTQTDLHGIIHGDRGVDAQLTAYRTYWGAYGDEYANRLLAPLNQLEGNTGRTYLDNMLVVFSCTGSFNGGHGGYDSQQILFGSMGGRIRAGRYYNVEANGAQYPYNGFLITLLQLMGISPAEYAYATPDGQGIGHYAGYGTNHAFRSRFYTPISEILA